MKTARTLVSVLALSVLLPLSANAELAVERSTMDQAHSSGMLNSELPLSDGCYADILSSSAKTLEPPKEIAHKKPAAKATLAVHERKTKPVVETTAAANEHQAPGAVPTESSSAVAETPLDPFTKVFADLVAAAETKNEEYKKYADQVDGYSNWKHRTSERARDMINYACLFKGVSPSSEAGDVILSEKAKLKHLAAAKFAKQKLTDDLELSIYPPVMQLSTGIGNADEKEGQEQVESAVAQLRKIVDQDTIDKAVAALKQLKGQASDLSLPSTTFSISEVRNSVDDIVFSAANRDAVIAQITQEAHHYNQHSPQVMAAHRAARVALSAASMTPNLIGPAAQLVLFTYLTASGGTEQEKILRELYIDKRLGSRLNVLNEQAHLAVYNYQLGALTNNKLLVLCSRKLVERMSGADEAAKVLDPRSASTETKPEPSIAHNE